MMLLCFYVILFFCRMVSDVMDNDFIFVEYNSTAMEESLTKPLQKSY